MSTPYHWYDDPSLELAVGASSAGPYHWYQGSPALVAGAGSSQPEWTWDDDSLGGGWYSATVRAAFTAGDQIAMPYADADIITAADAYIYAIAVPLPGDFAWFNTLDYARKALMGEGDTIETQVYTIPATGPYELVIVQYAAGYVQTTQPYPDLTPEYLISTYSGALASPPRTVPTWLQGDPHWALISA